MENLEYNPSTCNIESHDDIIINPDRPWEQVLWFLKKKQSKIDNLKNYFWKDINGIWFYLMEAFKRSSELVLEIPMKKNENNVDYDVIRIERETIDSDDYKIHENNIEVDKEYLKEKWSEKDIVVFETNLIALFEKLHIDRDKLFEDFDNAQSYLKAELNTYGFHIQ